MLNELYNVNVSYFQLLKMVLNNLVGYREDTSSTTIHPILACRLVNRH